MSFKFQNLPNATDKMGRSQSNLRQNYDYLQCALGKDHRIPFDSTANATPGVGTLGSGRHQYVSLLEAGASPTVQTADNVDSLLFSHQGNVFWKTSIVGIGPYQLTTGVADSIVPSFGEEAGWTFLPGGLLLQYGHASLVDPTVVTFPIPFPNHVHSIIVGGNSIAQGKPKGFQAVPFPLGVAPFASFIINSNVDHDVWWMAIGN